MLLGPDWRRLILTACDQHVLSGDLNSVSLLLTFLFIRGSSSKMQLHYIERDTDGKLISG
jgi:hypothetical protein